MKRKINYVVLLGEVCIIVILHVAKYHREKIPEFTNRSGIQRELSNSSGSTSTATNAVVMTKMSY